MASLAFIFRRIPLRTSLIEYSWILHCKAYKYFSSSFTSPIEGVDGVHFSTNSFEYFVDRIFFEAVRWREIPSIFQTVRQAFRQRFQTYITVDGCNSEL
ncbi:hypothetical protein AVEN_275744-1 [Araneus ventricosus]|uniref:Uncharacterized protein n=1 Tax=Araneus ventricosus TaxID=182803 RepID=A0A4Y2HNL8_ARAVE|nr:hypothetical protein AVEN_275744-1 [Araneus ventricosus]